VAAGSVIAVILLGVAAGVASGLFGVGGGIIFVPVLVIFVGLGQLEAEATSLLAVVPVAALGAWRQHAYGNVVLTHGIALGSVAIAATAIGVVAAAALPERVLEIGFAILLLVVAARLLRRTVKFGGCPQRTEREATHGV
jgi:uncharacterized membrane protein YfcA